MRCVEDSACRRRRPECSPARDHRGGRAAVEQHRITNLVVDPVMVAKGGARLLREDAVERAANALLPLAAVADTQPARGRGPARAARRKRLPSAARRLATWSRLGPRAVVVKGGHAEGDAVDVYWDGTTLVELAARGCRPPIPMAAAASSRRPSRPAWPEGLDSTRRGPGGEGIHHRRDRVLTGAGPRYRSGESHV